jgi:peptidoglycan/LPS O-acetylase OafA/YrhL
VLDALGLGCLLAYAWRATDSPARLARWAGLSGVLLIIGENLLTQVGAPSHVLFSIGPLGWALLCTWMVHRAALGVSGWPGRLLRVWPLVYVGTISYAIYLVHVFPMAIISWILHRFEANFPGWAERGRHKFVIVTLCSIGAATLSWNFFEGPINSLKRHFPYVKRAIPARTASSPTGGP